MTLLAILAVIIIVFIQIYDYKEVLKFGERIVGGENADISEFPYLVSVQLSNRHLCGAAILSDRTVVSAAHCFDTSTTELLTIRVNSSFAYFGGYVIKIRSIKRHPKYGHNGRIPIYDVAMVYLTSSMFESIKLNLYPDSEDDDMPVGAVVDVAGWGSLNACYLCLNFVVKDTHINRENGFNRRRDVSKLMVRACSNHTNIDGQVSSVAAVKYHPKFNLYNDDYDVSVLILVTPVINGIKINLPAVNEIVPVGATAVVAGWGETKKGGYYADRLQKIKTKRITNEKCNFTYDGALTSSMFCFSSDEKDVCLGDSGSPLVYKNSVIGIASWVRGCGRNKYPAVYINVAEPLVHAFITENIIE
ncbi:hypothetical protein RN001_010716 [Aquatica leii]|uniref:Peptidase S1 domain-containing protein n=1 Tax=Aquatica leii TaxID=1421715 RepID=A0AAN7Q3H8_9COLE|nr:hypothetical protein RN001_010716 [Aquatica leii]